MEILNSSEFWSGVGTLLAIALPAFAVQIKAAAKVVGELVSMHDQRSTSNSRIILDAENKGLKEAAKILNKRLTVKTLADES